MNELFLKVKNMRDTIYADQTKKIAHSSNRSHDWIFEAYSHYSNSIILCPLKNKKGNELKKKLEEIIA